MKQSLTNSLFIEKAISVHKNNYDYSKVDYINNHTKIQILCKSCEQWFEQTPSGHLGGRGCRLCGIKRRVKNQTYTAEQFIEKAIYLHGEKYSYVKVNYVNANTKIVIGCLTHSIDFEQTPGHHLDGSGCPKCSYESSAKLNAKSLSNFINEAKLIYGNDHNYHNCIYLNNKTKVKILCNLHQEFFEKTPADYFNGSSCPQCMKESFHRKMSMTTDQFIEKAKVVHGNIYDYSESIYMDSQTNVLIFCRKHKRQFTQTPNNHLSGKGCVYCSWSVSRQETEWLNSLGKNLDRQKTIKAGSSSFKVDGYDPIENIAYEFMGDFWHGNPNVYDANELNNISKKTFGELYNATMSKISLLKTVCKDVVVMWEQDWKLDKLKSGS